MRNYLKFYGLLFFELNLRTVRACTPNPGHDLHQIEEDSKERFTALLDSNPIKHVNDFKWADDAGWTGGQVGVPLVNIGGVFGTVCFDGFDDNAAKFFCGMLDWTDSSDVESISHEDVEAKYGTYPVLLTNVQCTENATSVLDCTSGPMGYASCSSRNDVQLSCLLLQTNNSG